MMVIRIFVLTSIGLLIGNVVLMAWGAVSVDRAIDQMYFQMCGVLAASWTAFIQCPRKQSDAEKHR